MLSIRGAFPFLKELHLSENGISQFTNSSNNSHEHTSSNSNDNSHPPSDIDNTTAKYDNTNNSTNSSSNNNNNTTNNNGTTNIHSYDKVTGFEQLVLLNLEGNAIEDWNEICRFSHLLKYVTLFLSFSSCPSHPFSIHLPYSIPLTA